MRHQVWQGEDLEKGAGVRHAGGWFLWAYGCVPRFQASRATAGCRTEDCGQSL